MSEQSGYLNESSLIEECARELVWSDLLEHETEERLNYIGIYKNVLSIDEEKKEQARLVLSVLVRRHLLNDLAIDLLIKEGVITPPAQ